MSKKIINFDNPNRTINRFIYVALIIALLITSIVSYNRFTTKEVVQVPAMQKVNSKYPSIDYSTVEYKDGNIISSILPYADFYSYFSKLPLGHTKASGKGVNIGIIGQGYGKQVLADIVYYTARDSFVYLSEELSVTQLLGHAINIAIIDDISLYDADEITSFVADCLKENIAVVIQGDLSETDPLIELTNRLENMGAITVGYVNREGLPYYSEEVRKPYNSRLHDININIFTSGTFENLEILNYRQALGSIGGALAMLLEVEEFTPLALKAHLIENSADVWISYDMLNPDNSFFNNVDIDPITSQYIPKENSSLYRFKQLDFEMLLDIKLPNLWASNIYNTYKAWDISKGNVDVAVIDQGFHPNAPFLKNNVTEAKAFGDIAWNGNFHGTSMVRSLLSIAPEAKLHLLLADVFEDNGGLYTDNIIAALNHCIQENISVVSLSWSFTLSKDENLINKIQEARDKGITVVWFHYPKDEEGIIRTDLIYSFQFSQMYQITTSLVPAFDRFFEDSMFYPQEINSGLSSTAPAVAGLVALIKEVKPELSPQEIKELLITIEPSAKKDGGVVVPDIYEIIKNL
ncbi:S8 family peptidase [Alkaliphilus transvaalensis]|uniref:S8 family peptidase n=1 Tax=Alkaliphilus transvaalensis TaxID=114628 RepID=UPI000478ABD6|nr:S8 family serine peptidase [Alkaliphilus transvaalensis]